MKRHLRLIVLGLALLGMQKVIAQPTVFADPSFIFINTGDNACIEFKVLDFTDIQEMRFSIRWNPNTIENVTVTPASLNASMPGLDLSDITIDEVDGSLVFIWKVENVPGCPTSDVTLPDNDVLFELCFDGVIGYTEMEIGDDPEPIYVTRTNSCPLNINLFTSTEIFIAVNNLPLTINVPFTSGFQGEQVCLNFTVENFTNIVSLQFSINWLPSVLEFVSVQGLNLPGWSLASFNTALSSTGVVTVSWFNPDPNGGVSVDDGTAILQMCFEVVGNCGQTSPVQVTSNPTPVEVTYVDDPGADIGVYLGDGAVSVSCFNPNSLTLQLPDADICPGESFCMDVTTENFTDLTEFGFSVNWDPSVIDLDFITNINTNLFLYNIADFNLSGANNGFFTTFWNDPSCFGDNLADGEILFTMCFTSVGGGGVNTTVAITGTPNEINVEDECFGNNIGINNFNGLVNVCSPPGIAVISGSADANPGEEVCIPIEVQDFTNVETMEFTIVWETAVLQLNSIGGFGLPDLTGANFDQSGAGFGALCVSWEDLSGLGLSVSDGTQIFELCFTAVGDPFECSEINFLEFPCAVNVITTESNGFNVGITPQIGEVCMLNPFNFATSIGSGESVPGEEVCVDVTVENFVSLGDIQYSINWDPDILFLNSVVETGNWPDFNSNSYDDSQAAFGVLTIDWSSFNPNGVSLPNGTAVFQLCFTLLGDSGDCSDVTITGSPSPIVVEPASAPGTNIGMLANPGEVCVSQFLSVLSANIIGVDCPGDNAGTIDLTIVGGSGTYTFNWSGPGITPPADDDEDQFNLVNGVYQVTVTDFFFPSLTLEETYTVGFSPSAPVSDAGETTSLPCGEITMSLDGAGSSTGAQYTYLWSPLGSGFVAPGTETTLTPTIVGADLYQLAVTDNSTSCTVFDTVLVNAAIAPGVAVEVQDSLTCLVDTVALIGENSVQGPIFISQWAGPGLVPGTETELNAQATVSGWYFLSITDTQSGCMTTDSIFVAIDTIAPIVVAGVDTILTCVNNTVQLDAAGSSTGTEFVYEWFDPQGDFLTNNLSATATEPGMYELVITDTISGCVGSDLVMVEADTLLPIALTAAPNPITCVTDTVNLVGEGSSVGAPGDFSYLWTGPGVLAGTEININAQATLDGNYSLTVVDNSNGCEAISLVTVNIDTLPPLAEANTAISLSCSVSSVQLDGSGSSSGLPSDFSYLWTGPAIQAGTETSLTPTVTAAGLYTLTVTQTSNGCTASDTVPVGDNSQDPTAIIALPDTLTCLNDFVTLDASGSSQGAQFQYVWAGPFCINTSDPLQAVVGCTGNFTLTVFDTSNGCSASDTVTVIEDADEPVAQALNTEFDCLDTEVTIDGSGSSQGAQFTYSWTVLSGSGVVVSGGDTPTPSVNGPGSFGLTVTNQNNGCVATTFATVVADTLPPAAVVFPTTLTLDCDSPTGTLSGTGSTTTGVSYQWLLNGDPVPGGTTLDLNVSAPGAYELVVTNTDNGCVASAGSVVDQQTTLPDADAGPDQSLTCSDVSIGLDGSGSSQGPTITYSWTALAGGTLDPGTVTLPISQAQSGGTYILTVTNTQTGCINTDTVLVTEIIGLPDADAGLDGDACSTEALLFGNLPNGTSGVWTVNTTAQITDPNQGSTVAEFLVPGLNVFTWTLSGLNCPDYSSDTVEIFIQQFPIANNDLASVTGIETSVEINLLVNDVISGIDEFTLEILPFADPGTLEPLPPVDGNLTYFASPFFNGEVEFDYVICNKACPDFCDTAFVRITVDQDIDINETIPNGITPNGDGANDLFIFDILLANPEKYPNNEIIIFNRWSDIIYTASPYNNDWDGTGPDGQPLPEGTYYYILRLNIPDSEVIQGDITIIR